MTLQEVLKHIFSDEDLNKEVVNYKVTHDLSCNEFTVLLEDGIMLKVHKIGD